MPVSRRPELDTLDDFLAGSVSGGRQAAGDSNRQTFQNNHSLYAQDTIRVSSDVTGEAGVRVGLLRQCSARTTTG